MWGGPCVQGRVSKRAARTSKPKVLEMFRHSQEDRTLFEAGSKISNYVSTSPARADRGSDPPEKQTKPRKNDLRIKTHLRFRLSAKSGSKGKPKTCKNLTTRSPERLAKPLQGNYRFLRKWWWPGGGVPYKGGAPAPRPESLMVNVSCFMVHASWPREGRLWARGRWLHRGLGEDLHLATTRVARDAQRRVADDALV